MGKTWHCSEVPIANVPKSFYSVLMEQNGTSTELTAMEEHLARLLGISDLLDEDRPAGLKALEQSGLASQEALSRAISAARLEILCSRGVANNFPVEFVTKRMKKLLRQNR